MTVRVRERRGVDRRALAVGLALLCAALLVHLAAYAAAPERTDSTTFRLLAGITIGFSVIVILLVGGGLIWLTPARLERLRERAAPLRTGAVILGLIVLFGFGTLMRPEWFYAHLAVTAGSAFALAYHLLYGDQDRPVPRAWFVAAGIVLAVAAAIRIYGLSVYPNKQITDEGWLLAWAVGYLRTGQFTDYLMIYGGHDVHRFYLPMAWWLSVVGIGYWQARLFTFLLLLPMIAFSGYAARNLFGRSAGWLTVAFMFGSAVVMSGARLRHDVGLGLAIAASLWAYSRAIKRDQAWMHLVAGVLMGLGWFGHYHAVGFGAALAVGLYLPRLVLRDPDANGRRGTIYHAPTPFLLYVIGGGIGAGIVFLTQVLPDWQSFLITRGLRNPLDLAGYIGAVIGHVGSITAHSQLELILLGVALIAAFWRRRVPDLSLALTVILAHLALGVMASETWDHYPMPLTPLYALLIGGLFAFGFRRGLPPELSGAGNVLSSGDLPADRLKLNQAVTALVFIIMTFGYTLAVPLQHVITRQPVQTPDPPVIAWIKANVPTDDIIVAEHYYYAWLTDYRMASVLSYNLGGERVPYESAEAMWAAVLPDVVMIDPNLSTCCVPPIMTPAFLEANGYQVVAQFDGGRVPVVVYKHEPSSPEFGEGLGAGSRSGTN